jgi:hypothetical protein
MNPFGRLTNDAFASNNALMQIYLYQNDKQVGPYTEKQLRDMVKAGAISQTEFAWREGLSEWQSLDRMIAFAPVAPIFHPPPSTSSVTHKGTSPPQPSKPILILACCILGAFFMPWVQLFGFAASGYNLGQLGSYGNYAWIIPILSGATIITSLSGSNNRGIGALTGIVPLGAIVYGLIRLAGEGGGDALNGITKMAGQVLSIGAYVTIICSIGIVLAAAKYPEQPTSTTSATEQ